MGMDLVLAVLHVQDASGEGQWEAVGEPMAGSGCTVCKLHPLQAATLFPASAFVAPRSVMAQRLMVDVLTAWA